MNEKFRVYTHGESRTGEGQLIEFSCSPDDKEKVKQSLLDIRFISLPQTHAVNLSHGSYGQYSRFDIKQHKYAGGGPGESGGWGYTEVLEISNPPDGRSGIVINECNSSEGSTFSEWASVAEAVAFWDKTWCDGRKKGDLKKVPGFKRSVKCGLLTPWFYAIGEQELVGEFAFPETLQEDPVFRFGTRCVVPEYESGSADIVKISLKTCFGCQVYEEAPDADWRYGGRKEKRTVRKIIWSDGTCYDSRNDFSGKVQPRPLLADELWVDEALVQFQKMLEGRQTQFVINFAGGGKFVGQFVPEKGRKEDKAGKYLGEVTFKEGESVKGLFDFVPSPDCLTAESRIRKGLPTGGKTIESVKVTRQVTESGGKKWSGVFFMKKGD